MCIFCFCEKQIIADERTVLFLVQLRVEIYFSVSNLLADAGGRRPAKSICMPASIVTGETGSAIFCVSLLTPAAFGYVAFNEGCGHQMIGALL